MAVYNISFMDNATSPLDLLTGLNSSTTYDFMFGNLLLIGFFMLTMILSYRFGYVQVAVVSSFLTSILAILLYTAGLLAVTSIVYPVVLFIILLVLYLIT